MTPKQAPSRPGSATRSSRAARPGSWDPRPPRLASDALPAATEPLSVLAERGAVADVRLEGVQVPPGPDEPLELAGCVLSRVRMVGAEVDDWRLRDMAATDCDLAGLVGSGLVLDAATFRGGRLTGCVWVGGTIGDVRMDDVTAGDFALRSARLRRVVFSGCSLPALDLTEAELDHVTFRNCDLSGATFAKAKVRALRVIGCELAGVRGVGGLAGAYVDAASLPALAPAMAAELGLRAGAARDLEALADNQPGRPAGAGDRP
ncbi:MAG: pentapeptide repeat-containing protein [Frankia sp.]